MLQHSLEQKEIANRQRFILARWRHVPDNPGQSRKDLVRGIGAVFIELVVEWWRAALADCERNTGRWRTISDGLGSSLCCANQAMVVDSWCFGLLPRGRIHGVLSLLESAS
jgi:hypothetical protein